MKVILIIMCVCLVCVCAITGYKTYQDEKEKAYWQELGEYYQRMAYQQKGYWEKVSALIDAAGKGDIEDVKRLIEDGADVNGIGIVLRKEKILGEIRGTALIEAIANGHTEIVKLLIDVGAFVNAKVRVFTITSGGGHSDGPDGPYPDLELSSELSILKETLSFRKNTYVTRPYQLDEKQLNEMIELLKAAGAKE